ncbi:MAG: hypothetical protein ACK5RG_18870 [Cyclobacteriaceae bacterium]|jgi:hypothetical protein
MNFKSYHYTRTMSGAPWYCCPDAILPEVKIERPIRLDIAARCKFIMRGRRIVGGHFVSFTGLQSTQWEGIYTGDLLLPNGKSFIVAQFYLNTLELYVAENYKVFPRSREKVVEALLKTKPRAI